MLSSNTGFPKSMVDGATSTSNKFDINPFTQSQLNPRQQCCSFPCSYCWGPMAMDGDCAWYLRSVPQTCFILMGCIVQGSNERVYLKKTYCVMIGVYHICIYIWEIKGIWTLGDWGIKPSMLCQHVVALSMYEVNWQQLQHMVQTERWRPFVCAMAVPNGDFTPLHRVLKRLHANGAPKVGDIFKRFTFAFKPDVWFHLLNTCHNPPPSVLGSLTLIRRAASPFSHPLPAVQMLQKLERYPWLVRTITGLAGQQVWC